MIASVVSTRLSARPIDFHIPRRLKSIGGNFLRNRFPNCPLAVKGGRTYTGGPSLSTQPAGAPFMVFSRGRPRALWGQAHFRLLDCPHYIRKSAHLPNDARLHRGFLPAGGSRGGADDGRDFWSYCQCADQSAD